MVKASHFQDAQQRMAPLWHLKYANEKGRMPKARTFYLKNILGSP
jgi:hypothetical protein